MPDIGEILKRAKPRELTVPLYLAGDAAAEVDQLEKQLAEVGDTWQADSLGSSNPAVEIAQQIKTARDKLRESRVDFRMRALGAKAWSDLVAEHPAKEKDHLWDPETFPRALVATCCVDPVMTAEQVDELFEVLNDGQRQELWSAAFDVNAEATSVPFSVSASGILASLTDGK